MARSPFNEIFELSPVRIELSFAHWGEDNVAVIDFDNDTGNQLQVISGLNGSGKTITLEAIKKITNVFTKPSINTLRTFENFARNVDLEYMMVEFKTNPVQYFEQETREDGRKYFAIDPHTIPTGWEVKDPGEDYGDIDIEKFEQYFGFPLNHDEWLYLSTTISKFAEFTFTGNETNWRFKQAGSVKVNNRDITKEMKTGELYWDEGWTKSKNSHRPQRLERDFILEIIDIPYAVFKTWEKESGIGFHDLDTHDTHDKACITIVKGASYLEVKHAYFFDKTFLGTLNDRKDEIYEIQRIASNKHAKEEFAEFVRELQQKSTYPEEYSIFSEVSNEIFDFSLFMHDDIAGMDIQEFIHHMAFKAPHVYLLLICDELSYLSLALIFLCEGAEFIDKDPYMLTAGQRRLISLAHQWYSTDKGELLLIDEPEISLHISWQRNFIGAFSKLNFHIADALLKTKTSHPEMESFKKIKEHPTPYHTLDLFVKQIDTITRKKMLIATHSPDIIYHHQELCNHIPPLDGD
jgi:hypothetical protein